MRSEQAVAQLARAGAFEALVDFDAHLDDPACDWLNAAVAAQVLAAVA